MKNKGDLTKKILIGLFLGMITGIIFYNFRNVSFIQDYVVGFAFELVGGVFISAIKMMVVPLVFVSLTVGAAAIGDIKKLGRIGGKTLSFYLVTTAIALVIALTLANVVDPGMGMSMPSDAAYEAASSPPFVQVLTDMVPTNPINAMAEGNMLQIIVFSLLFGASLTTLGEKGKTVLRFFEQLNDAILKMVEFIMLLAPYGVFALIAKTFAQLGWDAFPSLLAYMLTVLAALFIHAIVTYQGFLYAFTQLSPIQFFKNFAPAMGVGFSTASSSGTLPVTLETVEKRGGVSPNIASFTLPLGATINMDGTAIMQGVATIFIAQVFGVNLSLSQMITVVVTATLASIGTAGVPGVGLIMLSMVLQQVGLPVEGIALIIGVDRILDMTRTAINITGDAVCTTIIADSEGEFDREVFYSSNELETADLDKDVA